MKRLGPFVLSLFLLLSSSLAQKTPTIQTFREKEAAAKQRLARSIIKANLEQTESQKDFDVTYYDLRLDLDPTAKHLSGVVEMTARVLSAELATIDLNLSALMEVDSVFVNGLSADFTHAGNMLTIDPGQTIGFGETFRVRVHYNGLPNENRARAFRFDRYGGKPMIWSLSEPFGARTWWPCKDIPADKADSVDIRITVPSDLIAVSNGVLREVTQQGDLKTWWWHEKYPIVTYLVSVAIHPYDLHFDDYVYNDGADTMKIHYYTFAGNWDRYENDNLKVKQMIATFADLFGEYPFVDEKYGHADFLGGGAMEHQTCSSFGFWGEAVYAHELAHQWWGDLITCNSFHHIWLNEGFATYCEALWYEQAYGERFLHEEMARNAYLGPGTIYVENPQTDNIFSGALSYNKASWVLHMLRHVIGDSTFFHFLKVYYDEFAYRTATTEQFRNLCERVSGMELDTFFDQWIYKSGHPDYAYLYDFEKLDSVRYLVKGAIFQRQQNAPVFDMPVDLTIKMVRAETTLVLPVKERKYDFEVIVDKRPLRVVLDEDDWILKTVTRITDPDIEYYTHAISDSNANGNGVWEPGETAELYITLANHAAPVNDVTVTVSTPDNSIAIENDAVKYAHIGYAAKATNRETPFRLRADGSAEDHVVRLSLVAKAGNSTLLQTDIFLNLGMPNLLLVDDDDGADYERYYQRMAWQSGYLIQTHHLASEDLPSLDDLLHYPAVVWFTGDADTTGLTPAEREILRQYLDAGGRLVISGQYIARSLEADSSFLHGYLHAAYAGDVPAEDFIAGVDGDPIGDQILGLFSRNYFSAGNQHRQGIIEPVGGSILCFTYGQAGGAAAVRWENPANAGRLVFFSFGLEGIGGPDENTAQTILQRSLSWVLENVTHRPPTKEPLPLDFVLMQNYPNPFNPGTNIRFALPKEARVRIDIFNTLGQKIRTLRDEPMGRGWHTVAWDGTDANGLPTASGVYLVVADFHSGSFRNALRKKMVKLQ